jgi:putative addiction module CopG family antidote
MSTISVTLTPDLERFVEDQIRSGKYASQQEAIRMILSERKEREEHFDAWLTSEAAPAIAALDRGEYAEFSAEDIIAANRS